MINVPGVARYLIVPEGKKVPDGLDEDVQTVKQPIQNAYIALPELYEALAETEDEKLIRAFALAGFETDSEELTFAGKYDEIDFSQIVRSRCNLAVLPAVYADSRVTGKDSSDPDAVTAENLTDEQAQELRRAFDGFKELGLPAFVDRSADEESELAALDWFRLYGILLGREKAIEPVFKARAAELKEKA